MLPEPNKVLLEKRRFDFSIFLTEKTVNIAEKQSHPGAGSTVFTVLRSTVKYSSFSTGRGAVKGPSRCLLPIRDIFFYQGVSDVARQ